MRETFSVSRFVSLSCRFIVKIRVNTACEREDLANRMNKKPVVDQENTYVSFMLVAATVRALLPSSMSVIISS